MISKHLVRLLPKKWRPNRLYLDPIVRNGDTSVTYRYVVTGKWRQYFRTNRLTIDFGIGLNQVPDSVLVVPFLANILPIAWLCDAQIEVPSVDKNFYDCLDSVKQGYKDMYPMIEFKGKLKADHMDLNEPAEIDGPSSAFFYSAGVDSFFTFISHMDEHPIGISIWGSDIPVSDVDGWKNHSKSIDFIADTFGTQTTVVKSEFRTMIDEGKLSGLVESSGDDYWHGFQHGIAIICHAAPVCFLKNIRHLYIASSYDSSFTYSHVTCASYPTIDNHVRFGKTQVIHDAFEYSRIQKVHGIINFTRKTGIRLPLHVCWETTSGMNCSVCEKCVRTMLAIYACGGNPDEFGFSTSLLTEQRIDELMSSMTKARYMFSYYNTQKKITEKYNPDDVSFWGRWAFKEFFKAESKKS